MLTEIEKLPRTRAAWGIGVQSPRKPRNRILRGNALQGVQVLLRLLFWGEGPLTKFSLQGNNGVQEQFWEQPNWKQRKMVSWIPTWCSVGLFSTAQPILLRILHECPIVSFFLFLHNACSYSDICFLSEFFFIKKTWMRQWVTSLQNHFEWGNPHFENQNLSILWVGSEVHIVLLTGG